MKTITLIHVSDKGTTAQEVDAAELLVNKRVTATKPSSPTPAAIKAARVRLGYTQDQAASVIYAGRRAWAEWEAGNRALHPGLWELFTMKTKGE